jgi:hypothetical protein
MSSSLTALAVLLGPNVAPSVPADADARLDVLCLYAPSIARAVESQDELLAYLQTSITDANDSLARNGNARLDLVAILPLTVEESSAAVANLTDPSDGVLDWIDGARDTYGADVVVLWGQEGVGSAPLVGRFAAVLGTELLCGPSLARATQELLASASTSDVRDALRTVADYRRPAARNGDGTGDGGVARVATSVRVDLTALTRTCVKVSMVATLQPTHGIRVVARSVGANPVFNANTTSTRPFTNTSTGTCDADTVWFVGTNTDPCSNVTASGTYVLGAVELTTATCNTVSLIDIEGGPPPADPPLCTNSYYLDGGCVMKNFIKGADVNTCSAPPPGASCSAN